MNGVFIKAILVVIMAFQLISCGGASPRAGEKTTSAQILRAVNSERGKRGLRPLVGDEGLRRIAESHAEFLLREVHPAKRRPTREIAHAQFEKRSQRAIKEGYQVLSEVVMIGYAGDLSAVPQRTIRGWLNSPAHRRAILQGDRKVMGIETRLPADGRYFVVGLLSNGKEKGRGRAR